MKAYLYNTENGLYEGEAFESADLLRHEAGITPVPPPAYEHGHVPVFNLQKNSWTVLPVAIVRQLLTSSTDSTS